MHLNMFSWCQHFFVGRRREKSEKTPDCSWNRLHSRQRSSLVWHENFLGRGSPLLMCGLKIKVFCSSSPRPRQALIIPSSPGWPCSEPWCLGQIQKLDQNSKPAAHFIITGLPRYYIVISTQPRCIHSHLIPTSSQAICSNITRESILGSVCPL